MEQKIGNIFKGDKVIWMVFLLLSIISITEVFSAASTLTYRHGNYMMPMLAHASKLVLGFIAMVVVLNIKCKYFKAVTPFVLIFAFVTLILVHFMGKVNGASRWVTLFGIPFQPSEIAKGAMVLATAQILSAMQTPKGADSHAFRYILVVCAFIIPLIMIENLSTAVLLCAVIFMMMLIGRVPVTQLGKLLGVVTLIVAIGIAAVLAFGKAKEQKQPGQQATEQVEQVAAAEKSEPKVFHRLDTWKARINRFFEGKQDRNPQDIDLEGNEAQSAFANIAIASSNIVGKGPGNSDERDFLSQAYSDFIYAIILEEMGIAGGFFVAFLYIVLLFRTGRIAGRCENNFPAFLAMGLALMLVTQALFNMCVAVGIVPVTGQPLPLISRGGTSTVINCIYLGMILSVSRSAKKRDEAIG